MNPIKAIIQFFKEAQRETSIRCLLEERERNKRKAEDRKVREMVENGK